MKYRVIIKASYVEVHFDFDNAEEAARFAITAIEHLTLREDGKDCFITFTKVDVVKEAEEEKKEEEDE